MTEEILRSAGSGVLAAAGIVWLLEAIIRPGDRPG
jgi:hypothetical protein